MVSYLTIHPKSLIHRYGRVTAVAYFRSGDSSGQSLVARALFDFTATRSDELSFAAGDELVLAPRRLQNGGDWLLAGRNRRSG